MNISELDAVGHVDVLPLTLALGLLLILTLAILLATVFSARGPSGPEFVPARRSTGVTAACAATAALCAVFALWQIGVVTAPYKQGSVQRNIESIEQWAEDEYDVNLTDIDLDQRDVSNGMSLGKAAADGIDASDDRGRPYRLTTDFDGDLMLLAKVHDDPELYALVETQN
ncbi:MAG: hypothetical protein ACTMHH_05095 [Nesterenkonia sp.]